MSDLYYELLVKKNQTAKDKLTKFGLIGAIVMNCNPFTLGHK